MHTTDLKDHIALYLKLNRSVAIMNYTAEFFRPHLVLTLNTKSNVLHADLVLMLLND